MEDVLNRDTNAPVVPEKGQGKDEQVTLSKAEVEALRRDRDEARESERYWAGMYRSGSGNHQERVEEVEENDASEFIDPADAVNTEIAGDTPEKLVDEFAAQGVAALSKRGFITKADAMKIAADVALKVSQTMIGRERQKMTGENTLLNEFPELKDQSSELFKATAKIYQEAVAMDPNAKKTPAALFLAAKAAKAGLKPAAPARRRADDDDDRDERENESDRRRRSDSQDSRPRGNRDVQDNDDMLDSEARQVIKAMGISEEEFKASQKAMGGRGRQR